MTPSPKKPNRLWPHRKPTRREWGLGLVVLVGVVVVLYVLTTRIPYFWHLVFIGSIFVGWWIAAPALTLRRYMPVRSWWRRR